MSISKMPAMELALMVTSEPPQTAGLTKKTTAQEMTTVITTVTQIPALSALSSKGWQKRSVMFECFFLRSMHSVSMHFVSLNLVTLNLVFMNLVSMKSESTC